MVTGQEYDPEKTDMWSAGVTLFYMLTGKLPFNDKHIKDLYKKIVDGVIDYPVGISQEAVDFLRGILRTNPKSRLGFKEAFQHPWMKKYQPGGYPLIMGEEEVVLKLT